MPVLTGVTHRQAIGSLGALGCLLFAAAWPASAGDGPKIELRAKPDKLVLGSGQTADLQLRISGPGGEPITDAQLRLSVNVGHLDPPKQHAPGLFTARYHPPTTNFPQVALFGAIFERGPERAVAFGAVPLYGYGIAQVESPPKAKVQITIDQVVFGPVRADAYGRAKIPIQVPPGVRFGTSKGKQIDLKLPEFNRLHVLAEDLSMPCDGSRAGRIWLFAVDERGRPAGGEAPRVSADQGRLGSPEPQVPGVWSIRFDPPERPGAGRVRIAAELTGQPASRANVELALGPGRAVRLELAAEPESYAAGSNQPIQIAIQPRDANGNPVQEPVELRSDFGTIGPTRPAGPERTVAELRLPDSFAGRRVATITARAAGGPDRGLQAQLQVPLLPGPADRLEIDVPPGPLVADGQTPVWLALQVRDSFGNSLPPDRPTAAAQSGQASVEANAQGQPGLRYTPPLLRQAGQDELQATSGALSARAQLQLTSEEHHLCLTPRVGYHTNFFQVHSPLFSLELAWRLPIAAPGFWLGLEGGYGFSNDSDAGLQADSHLSLAPLVLVLTYERPVHPAVHLMGSVGLGALFVTSRLAVEGQPDLEQTVVRFGLQVSLGAGFALGPGRLQIELRYLDGFGGSIAHLSGRVGGLEVVAGYRIGLY